MSFPTFGPDKFNLPQHGPGTANVTGMSAMTTPAAADHAGSLTHPGNPLFAFGVLALFAFGLMAASTTVRVGHTAASINIGDTKK